MVGFFSNRSFFQRNFVRALAHFSKTSALDKAKLEVSIAKIVRLEKRTI